jgi:5-formyltetrahydrofolate cyclo-ligase
MSKIKNSMIEKNVWHSPSKLHKAVEMVERLISDDEWQWFMNTTCKYVSFRIDMRTGFFIMLDREGKRIMPKDLKYQHSKESTESKDNR